MQNVSETYIRLLNTQGVIKEHKATIAGVEYGEADIVGTPVAYNDLYAGADGPAVGQTNSAIVELSVLPKGIVPKMAEIRLFTRLVLIDHMTETIAETSEWIPKGVFLLDNRKKDAQTGAMELKGYDRMLLAEDFYLKDGKGVGKWPRPMDGVVAEICERIGVEPEVGFVIDPAYRMPFPDGLTMREMLGYAAACHGCNATITEAGYLRFVPFVPLAAVVSDLGREMQKLETDTPLEAFSGVVFYDGDEVVAFAGDESGRVLDVECPWGTDKIAGNVLASIRGYVYAPYAASNALLDPAVELGDRVIIDGTERVLVRRDAVFSGLMPAEISAPWDADVDHEIPFVDKQQKRTERAIKRNQAILWTGIDQADHLSTSQKIAKYLLGDTSEDDFLRVQGLGITWIRARTDGSEEQATDEDGNPLYWDPAVEKAVVEVDGWYYAGSDPVKMTVVETPYPVMTYAYEEQVIAQWQFMPVANPDGTGAFFPTIVMGAGTDPTGETDNGKFKVIKHFSGADIKYQTSMGKQAGTYYREDGFVDVTQRRASITLDDTNKVIVVRPEGTLADSYSIEFTEDENGNMDLTWPDGYTTRVEVI